MTGQLKLNTDPLPELWITNINPPEDGYYMCRIKNKGEYYIKHTEFKDGEFKTEGIVVAWR